jgi:predicted ArsR family transcriptional regulator
MTDLFTTYAARKAAENTPGLARNDGTDTSKEAAAVFAPRSGKNRRRVLEMMAAVQGPVTAEFLETTTGMTGNTVRPRLCELRRDGFVRKAEGYGLTRAGNKAELHELTEKGRAAVRGFNDEKAE